MSKNRENTFRNLYALGISCDDAAALVRASAVLSSWGEHECNGTIERDDDTGHCYRAEGGRRLYRTADRETGALKRAERIVASYPGLSVYYQSDPRGCALYVIRPGDVPPGQDVGGYYSCGIAVVPR